MAIRSGCRFAGFPFLQQFNMVVLLLYVFFSLKFNSLEIGIIFIVVNIAEKKKARSTESKHKMITQLVESNFA